MRVITGKKNAAALFSSVWPVSFTPARLLSAARLGTWQRRRRFHGDGAAELPGRRPRGIPDGSKEVHRVLHLRAVFHHAR